MPAVNVNQATYDAFRAAVFEKYGKLRGALQDEADAALNLHIPAIKNGKT